jgi:hypothetical protein
MRAERNWICPNCNETIQVDWDTCWNCGTNREGQVDPQFDPEVRFHPQCKECGYLLIGLPEARCPECGQLFDPTEKDTPRELFE